MKNSNQDKPGHAEDQIKQLQKENNRLQRIIRRHETQLQHLDKMASANEKTNIALYKELEVLQQQAEAQAREAQIEAALERVRARSMAMHKSEELKEVIQLVYEQFVHLNINVEHTGFIMDYKTRDDYNSWIADKFGTHSQVTIPYFDCVYYNRFNEAKEKGEDFFATNLSFEEKNKFYQDLFKIVPGLPEDALEFLLSCPGLALSTVLLDNVALYIENLAGTSYTDDENAALMRFGKVFQQTYTRFLDLQKAEAQAREAQIEAALERVRARAMAMHHSDDLDKVNKEILNQLNWLQVPDLTGVTFYLIDEHGWVKAWDFSSPGNMGNPNSYALQYDFKKYEMMGEPFKILRQTDLNYFVADYPLEKLERAVYELEEINPAVANVFKEALANGILTHQWTACARISDGLLGIDLASPPSEDTKTIVLKIAGAFNQAYQRFLDLQRAEAQARQALQQASLERVRAEIASMRSTGDLQRITPLIWRELTTLGVPFFRCGVFIIDEVTELTHAYLSTPLGEAFAALHMKFDSAPFIHAAVEHWRQQQVYREEWNREQFLAWTQSILKLGLIDSPEKYQAGGEAPEKLVLHFVPFTQGMLYIGSSAALSNDEIVIGQALANAFGVAYARYEDFQRLEAAKAQVEAALENLKKTQQQLVTQEKLASLGQLTAGIAHEIKNPLNFVNNFAALSVDLAKELREEIVRRKTKSANGDDFADIEEILDTLEQNAEKINHHGKRADSIVKSMMQHARGSSGQREMADINQLLDEAVNLTYHGMRANDPSFNITIEKEYDESIEKIQVVPQDLSRVFLNLINNACYAAHQKKKASADGFSPTLSVATKSAADKIEIRIRDNGNGIPKDIREKIFNPFFTTKPTGQGTGLGLSISHDLIVQQHRGEIKVETEEGKFTEFVISLRKA
ncbi:ATP-binding protein [bacterium]|nr:ATP-binding protein [bacterium]